MGFLQSLLQYQNICIQCHNNPDPDTIASAFGIYSYLKSHTINARMVYGGPQMIEKSNLKLMLNKCNINLEYTHNIFKPELLLLVDCQYAQGNVEKFEADNIMIIDHHIPVVDITDNCFIDSSYQSCSTIIWNLLSEENFPFKEYPELIVALLYGLYTDTACFADLYNHNDLTMKNQLYHKQPLFEQLTKSNMSLAEFMISTDALHNHYFDIDKRFAIVDVLKCDQSVLGIIGDFIIQVDLVLLSFAYTENDISYQISLRSCHPNLPANTIAEYICDGIGSGGGHVNKAGGRIIKDKLHEKYGQQNIFSIINTLLCRYMDENNITF